MARNPGLFDGNAFKLGLFGPNCSEGLSFVDSPRAWDGSWEHNVALAQLADRAGLECIVPIARWKGYGGQNDPNHDAFETLAWACGLLALTQRISIFATVHVHFVHPIFAAKQMVTADWIGSGRLGLNIVCGSHAEEFAMFGTELGDHDTRYDYGQEWWDIVKAIWSGAGPSDLGTTFFHLKNAIGGPRPFGGTDPPMMNAGASPAGRDFAVRNSDFHFDHCGNPDEMADRIAETKAMARAQRGREIQAWTQAGVVCRATQSEVDEFLEYCLEHAAWDAVGNRNRVLRGPHGSQSESQEQRDALMRKQRAQPIVGRSGYPIFGTPDAVAAELYRFHRGGFDGVVMNFVNYLDELPFFVQEVIPRLERLGCRMPAREIPAPR